MLVTMAAFGDSTPDELDPSCRAAAAVDRGRPSRAIPCDASYVG
jgi:hypothetical protein